MDRRSFVKGSLATGATVLSGSTLESPAPTAPIADSKLFTLKYAPEFGLFTQLAGEDPVEQIKFGYEQGFRAWEDTFLLDKSEAMQEKISAALQELGVEFGMFVGHVTFEDVTFAGTDQAARDRVLEDVRASVEIAQRMNTEYVHIVLGCSAPKLSWGFQMANAIELLKRCAEIFASNGLTMIMEPMNHRIDHPGMFLHRVGQAYELCRAVDSPACKILFDIYHVQIQEGNLLPNIDQAWDEIAYFQIGDTPGRNEPLTGEINYRNIFAHLHEKGYEGFLGLEHGHAQPGPEGERAVIEAYRTCDPNGSEG